MKENYPIFVKWMDATDRILSAVDKFPKSVRGTLSNRIVNLSLDISEAIVEAIYTKNRSDILNRINLILEKLRVLFRIAFKRQYISTKQYEHISEMINETGRMVGGWKK